jgi:hypothetical protein
MQPLSARPYKPTATLKMVSTDMYIYSHFITMTNDGGTKHVGVHDTSDENIRKKANAFRINHW